MAGDFFNSVVPKTHKPDLFESNLPIPADLFGVHHAGDTKTWCTKGSLAGA